jgi:hypothetical protein
MESRSVFHGPIVDDFRRWLRTVTLHKSTSGAPKSSCSRPTGWARTRSCAGRPSQRPASGDGKTASWRKVLMRFCVTRHVPHGSSRSRRMWRNGWLPSSVQRTWRANGLQPHWVRQFKLSNDPKFVDKLRDVVGLYVDPPAHAIVLSVDEKSQIQALDRTQPGLPLKQGACWNDDPRLAKLCAARAIHRTPWLS